MATSSRLSDMLLKVQDDGLDTAAALLETYNKKLQKFRAANPTMGFNVVSVLAEHETWEVYCESLLPTSVCLAQLDSSQVQISLIVISQRLTGTTQSNPNFKSRNPSQHHNSNS